MRLIDCEPLIDECEELISIEWNRKVSPPSWADAEEEFMKRLEEAPIIDAVPVVRCGQCKFDNICCRNVGKDGKRTKDDFCSYGERMCEDAAD